MAEEIIIDGVDVSKCNYIIIPKKQCPMKYMPYAKESSCISCKEHNTKLNFCKNNHNCYYKQLQAAHKDNANLREDNIFLKQTLDACEKEYRALTTKYNELVKR